jgi:ACS family hexuronate transporter-like MFS transporter
MPAEPASSRPAVPAWNWWVVWMLFLATVVNYLDRQTLSSTADYITRDFGLDKVQYGQLEMSFGLAYAVFLIVAGFMSDRFNLRWLFTFALLIWSAAGFATGSVHSFFALMACRAILGVGEAFNWPCAVGIIQRVLPREARSLGNGIFNSGMTLGAVAMPLLVEVLVNPKTGEGWRTLFQGVGLAGTVWVVLWLISTQGVSAQSLRRPADNTGSVGEKQPFMEVFLINRFWITAAVGITVNIAWHFLRVWMLFILKEQLHIEHRTRLIMAGYFLVADLGSIVCGWAIRRLTAKSSVERARMKIMFVSAGLILLGTPILITSNPCIIVPLFFLVGAGIMGGFAIFYSLVQDVSPQHSSKCLGLIGSSVWFIIAGLKPIEGMLAERHYYPEMIVFVCVLPMLIAPTLLGWKPASQEPMRTPTLPS